MLPHACIPRRQQNTRQIIAKSNRPKRKGKKTNKGIYGHHLICTVTRPCELTAGELAENAKELQQLNIYI